MNERIKQLAIQADIKFLEFHGKEYCEAWVEQQEKFAELIIQECGEIAYGTYWENPEGVRGIHIKDAILKNFGVE